MTRWLSIALAVVGAWALAATAVAAYQWGRLTDREARLVAQGQQQGATAVFSSLQQQIQRGQEWRVQDGNGRALLVLDPQTRTWTSPLLPATRERGVEP